MSRLNFILLAAFVACAPAPIGSQRGEACTRDDECSEGLECIATDGGSVCDAPENATGPAAPSDTDGSECEQHLTRDACEAAGSACQVNEAFEIALLDGECVTISESVAWCHGDGLGGAGAHSSWYEEATGRVFSFSFIPANPLPGWTQCQCEPAEPAACQCASGCDGGSETGSGTGTGTGGTGTDTGSSGSDSGDSTDL